MTDPVGSTASNRTYADPDEHELVCRVREARSNADAGPVRSSQLEAWDRMEALYDSPDGSTCNPDLACYADLEPEAAEAPPAEALASRRGDVTDLPESYEQCVNRMTRESSVTGRWAGATAGCLGAAATVAPAGPVGLAGMCVVGGVGGYYAGGAGGAQLGEADAKVECDRLDKAGSPSDRALRELDPSAFTFYGPI